MTTTDADLIVYSRADCGYCRKLKGRLDKAGLVYDERPIEDDAEAARFVESANDGQQIVPTVVFPDGTVATNPDWDDVAKRLSLD